MRPDGDRQAGDDWRRTPALPGAGQHRQNFLVSRGMGAAQGKKVMAALLRQAGRGTAGLRPDQAIERAVWSGHGTGKERRRWQPRMLISLTGLSPADWLARDRHCASFSKRPARRAARDHRSSLPLERSAIPTARPRATTRVSCRSAHRSIPAS
ncbi:hypothetical protein Pden_1519 [Paracoccus denitrificans PD1222]|uniref:Uncharacterized protein n=1 Tax=Paracoccus denitrificans (strain Pd 1222) TaxID=318586 RepID=A1B275_PARDP|nr:hypothetical protein Pden_1519 [Paracoccus denitrificans PD1222]